MKITGIIVEGTHGATRAISIQKKIFKEKRLPGIDKIYDGTINIDITPNNFEILKYDYYCEKIRWININPEEDFGFIKINEIRYNSQIFENPGYIYFPSKSQHTGKKNEFEVIAVKIPAVEHGRKIEIFIDENKIRLANAKPDTVNRQDTVNRKEVTQSAKRL